MRRLAVPSRGRTNSGGSGGDCARPGATTWAASIWWKCSVPPSLRLRAEEWSQRICAEIRHPQGAPEVKAAVESLDDEGTFLSVVTLGELAGGVARLAQGRRRRELMAWLDGLETHFADRIPPFDPGTARLRGELDALAQNAGRRASATDGVIAATALVHGLHVMTRNVADFAPLGALTVNPWDNGEP